MRWYIFGILVHFIAAIFLIFTTLNEMNNLDASIVAIMSIIAGILEIKLVKK